MRPVQPFIQCKNVFGWVRAAATKESINENIQQKYILYSNWFQNQTSFASHIASENSNYVPRMLQLMYNTPNNN